MPDTRGSVNLTSNYPLDKAKHGSPELHKIGVSLLDPTYVAPINPPTPGANGVGTVGTSDEVARADHVHGLNFAQYFFEASLTAEPFTLTTSNQVLTGSTSGVLTVPRTQAVLIQMAVDAEGSAAGYGIIVVTLEFSFNGGGFTAWGQAAIMGTLGGLRLTVNQNYGANLAAGSWQFRMIGAKSAAGGTAVLHATHTRYQGIIVG